MNKKHVLILMTILLFSVSTNAKKTRFAPISDFKKRAAKAIDYYKKSLELNPGNKGAAERIKQLER